MKNTWRLPLILGSVAILTVFSFQNCAGGFSPGDSNASSLSSEGPVFITTGALSAQLWNASGSAQVPMGTLTVGTAYMLHASGAGILDAAVIWDMNAANNGAQCEVDGTGNALVETITCAATGSGQVDITSYWDDGSVSTASVTVTVTNAAPATGGGGTGTTGNVIIFNITAGTGNNAWNTYANQLIAYVGQTIRITNKDSQIHTLHTNGSPCPHQPNDSAPGAYYDCVLASGHTAGATAGANDLYDHTVGQNAAFYLTVYDGPALYATGGKGNCAACHAGLIGSGKHGATFAQIKSAISTVGSMQNLRLTDDEIKAVAFSLSL